MNVGLKIFFPRPMGLLDLVVWISFLKRKVIEWSNNQCLTAIYGEGLSTELVQLCFGICQVVTTGSTRACSRVLLPWRTFWVLLEHPHPCLVCDSAKNISHIQVLVIYFFATPPIKPKLGLQIYVGTTNSKPPGRIIMFGQSKTGTSSQIIFITLSLAGVLICCAF
jgi:hypothetical protein